MSLRKEDESTIQEFPNNIKGDQKDCSENCAACCIILAIKINGKIFKQGGERCKFLTPTNKCSVWGTSEQPDVCKEFTCRTCSPNVRNALRSELNG